MSRTTPANAAWHCRSGIASINQDVNNNTLKGQLFLNGRNEFYDANLNRVSIFERGCFMRGWSVRHESHTAQANSARLILVIYSG